MWPGLPYLGPMATVIDDNIDAGVVPDGTWPIWTGGHCSPEVVQSETGQVNRFACHSNFMEAARPVGSPNRSPLSTTPTSFGPRVSWNVRRRPAT